MPSNASPIWSTVSTCRAGPGGERRPIARSQGGDDHDDLPTRNRDGCRWRSIADAACLHRIERRCADRWRKRWRLGRRRWRILRRRLWWRWRWQRRDCDLVNLVQLGRVVVDLDRRFLVGQHFVLFVGQCVLVILGQRLVLDFVVGRRLVLLVDLELLERIVVLDVFVLERIEFVQLLGELRVLLDLRLVLDLVVELRFVVQGLELERRLVVERGLEFQRPRFLDRIDRRHASPGPRAADDSALRWRRGRDGRAQAPGQEEDRDDRSLSRAQRFLDFGNGMAGEVLRDFAGQPVGDLDMIMFAQLTQRVRRCSNDQ